MLGSRQSFSGTVNIDLVKNGPVLKGQALVGTPGLTSVTSSQSKNLKLVFDPNPPLEGPDPVLVTTDNIFLYWPLFTVLKTIDCFLLVGFG